MYVSLSPIGRIKILTYLIWGFLGAAIFDCIIMPPTLKKLMGHIAFGACVSGCVGAWVRHTFSTYCNF